MQKIYFANSENIPSDDNNEISNVENGKVNDNFNSGNDKNKAQKPFFDIFIHLSAIICIFMFFFSAYNSFIGLFSWAVCPSFYAYLLIKNQKFYYFASPVAGFLLSAFFLGTSTNLLYILFPLCLGIVIYLFFTKEKAGKTEIVVASTAVYIFISLFIILISFTNLNGVYSFSNISANIDSFFAEIDNYFKSLFNDPNISALLEAYNIKLDGKAIDDIILNAKLMLPSLYVIICTVLSYLTVSAFSVLMKARNETSAFKGRKWEISLSKVSATAFVISSLVILLTSDKKYMVINMTFTNIMYALSPGFILMGIKSIIALIKNKIRGFTRILIYFGIIILTLLTGQIGLNIILLFGLWKAIGNK